ncbi:MAG: hypothetical protein WD557_03175 [Dehalococcoidia bacterium]
MGRGGRGAQWAAGYVLAVVFGVAAIVALSENGDQTAARGNTEPTTVDAPVEIQAAVSTPTAAPTPTPTPRPVGTDEGYVRGLCVAMDEFFRDVETATRTITPADPAGVAREFAKAFGPPLVRFAEDMNQIAPPADVMAWHDKAAEDLGRIAARIQAGEGLTEIARLGDRPLPDLPDAIQQRIGAAAATVPECSQFEDAFGM